MVFWSLGDHLVTCFGLTTWKLGSEKKCLTLFLVRNHAEPIYCALFSQFSIIGFNYSPTKFPRDPTDSAQPSVLHTLDTLGFRLRLSLYTWLDLPIQFINQQIINFSLLHRGNYTPEYLNNLPILGRVGKPHRDW